MNDDASTFDLPEYIHSRLQPQILIDFPERDEENTRSCAKTCPFADDQILNYVTDFLQQAHAADERYTVRDGINIARYAMKLKNLATRRPTKRRRLETSIVLRPSGRKRCVMSGDIDLLVPESGSLVRGRFTYFPVVPGRLEFAIEVRQAILRQRPPVVAVELPGTLQQAWLRAVERLPEISVIFYPDDAAGVEDRAVYIPVEPADPFTEAIRTALEIGAEIVFADPDIGERPHLPDLYPDPYAVRRIGLDRYVEAYRLHPQPRSPEVARHADGIAWKLQGADPLARVFVVVSLNLLDPVLDAMEQPQAQPMARVRREHVQVVNPHPDRSAEIAVEYPFLQHRYEQYRRPCRSPADRPPRAQFALFRDAEKSYANTGERVAHWQRRMLARYTRNLAMASAQLTAGLFDLTVAARSMVDDNYAWEVWETAGRYPPQKTVTDIQTVDISGEEVWLDTKKIRCAAACRAQKRRLRPVGLKPRKKRRRPASGPASSTGSAICSYPPEDLVVEDYGRFLKRRARASSPRSAPGWSLSPPRSSTASTSGRPFATGTSGKHLRPRISEVAGEVGSVVVIFDEDRQDTRYPYLTTWLGENQNESDMAFYSTFPFDNLVGPGIGRGEYGGFLMSLPPRRMYDVWRDPDYEFAETKPERLLLAGLDYSIDRLVVYVAPSRRGRSSAASPRA
jgi:hypothetical protein